MLYKLRPSPNNNEAFSLVDNPQIIVRATKIGVPKSVPTYIQEYALTTYASQVIQSEGLWDADGYTFIRRTIQFYIIH